MFRSQSAFITFACEALVLGVINLIIYVPMFFRLLFRKKPWAHAEITSDIPGNPHVFNNLVISLFQTLPEPNNFNLVWTRVPLEEDLIVRGKIPHSRMSSFSVYGEGSDGVPNTIELCSNIDPVHRDFEVVLTKYPEKFSKDGKLVMDTKDWKFGMCVMRNYLVPPGAEVYTPEVITASSASSSTPTIIREAQQLVSGPANLHLDLSPYFKRLQQFLLVNGGVWLINGIFKLFKKRFFLKNMLVTLAGMAVCALIQLLLYQLAKKNLRKFVDEFCQKENELYLTSLKESSKGSQPSRLHRYWIMRYEIPEQQELQVTGRIDPKNQQYWSFVIYDEYGIPLPQFPYDLNVQKIPEGTEDDAIYRYDIRMKNYGKVGNRISREYLHSQKGSNTTPIDVSKASKGYVLFRLVHPTNDGAVEFSKPSTSLLVSNHSTSSTKQKLQ